MKGGWAGEVDVGAVAQGVDDGELVLVPCIVAAGEVVGNVVDGSEVEDVYWVLEGELEDLY